MSILVLFMLLLAALAGLVFLDPRGEDGQDSDGDGIPDVLDLLIYDRDNDGVRDSMDFFPDYEGALLVTLENITLLQPFHSYTQVDARVTVLLNGEEFDLLGENITLQTGTSTILDATALLDVPDGLPEGTLCFSIQAYHPSDHSLDAYLSLESGEDGPNISYIYESSPALDVNQSTASWNESSTVEAVLNFSVQAAPMSKEANFQWTFQLQSYSLNLTIENHLYYYYNAHDVPRRYTGVEAVSGFITPDDPIIASLAENLSALFQPNWSEGRNASLVMRMVQSMTYALDNETSTFEEYWSFPVETLFMGMGDCEDTTFLLASLYRQLGYECAVLLFFPSEETGLAGHAAVAVAVTPLYHDPFCYRYQEVCYYYVETTATHFALGQIWVDYLEEEPIFIPV